MFYYFLMLFGVFWDVVCCFWDGFLEDIWFQQRFWVFFIFSSNRLCPIRCFSCFSLNVLFMLRANSISVCCSCRGALLIITNLPLPAHNNYNRCFLLFR